MCEPVIETVGLCRDYGKKRALDAFSIAIPKGRIVALLGPNGAGKTTLLKLLLSLIEPTEGAARVLGHEVRGLPPDVAPRIQGVLDGCEPPRWATVTRMMNLQSEISPHFDRPLAEQLCLGKGIENDTYYGTLSKGQKRRVLAGVAIASGADLLLLDEPADGLDTASRRALYDQLRETANDRELTVLVATHLIHDIERVADDIALLRQGRLLLEGSLDDLRDEVCEVELDPSQEVPGGDGLVALAARDDGDTRLAWIRATGGEAQLRKAVGPHAPMRPVGLEDLYLALTETPPEESADQPKAKEAEPCA